MQKSSLVALLTAMVFILVLMASQGFVAAEQTTNLQTPSPTPCTCPSPTPTPVPAKPAPTVDKTPPSVTIMSHSSGTTVSGTITVTANVSDNVGIDATYLIVDDAVKTSDSTSPFTYALNTTTLLNGQHVMFIRAWDAAANAGDSVRITFTVANGVPTPTPTPIPTPTPTPNPTGQLVTFFTANVSHGQGTDAQFDISRQVTALVSAQIIGAQEVTPGDLPNWDARFAALGFSRTVYFPNSTGPNNTNDGQALWTSLPFRTVYTKKLSEGFISWDGSTNVDKSAIAVEFVINGQRVLVANTHLCWSRCTDAQRSSQATTLLSWIASLGYSKVVLMGDMNFTTTYPQYPLFSAYVDAWKVSVEQSKATANWGDRDGNGLPDMPVTNITTLDVRHIDHFFITPNLEIVSMDLPDLRAPCPHPLVADGGSLPACTPEVVWRWDITGDFGIRPMDHNPLKLVLRF